MTVIDAKNLIVGRMSTQVAKRGLLGEKIDIINCEKAIITGRKSMLHSRYKERKERGNPLKGPYLSMMPDRFIRRVIRGMLPYKQTKGRNAFKNIMCYIGIPEKIKNKKVETIECAKITKSRSLKFITIEDLCNLMKK